MRKASSTERPATSPARARASRAAAASRISSGDRPSVWSSADATLPSAACATRIRPRAMAGESRTRSLVSTDSISSSRAAGSASQRRASTYGKVAGSTPRDRPLSGTARGTRASSSARSRPARCEPCRRTTTARSRQGTPSSTWIRRSSRATAACSSETCEAHHASSATGSGARYGVSSRTCCAANRSVKRRIGTSVVPWKLKTCASGSPAATRSGARRPSRRASAARVVSWRSSTRTWSNSGSPLSATSAARCSMPAKSTTLSASITCWYSRRNAASSCQPLRPRSVAAASMSSGDSSDSCARERNWRTSSANPRSSSMRP